VAGTVFHVITSPSLAHLLPHLVIVRGATFTMRPWHPSYGDPGVPIHVLGLEIDRRLCERADRGGALVALVDGRYALTGLVLAVGPAAEMHRFLRRRTRQVGESVEMAWLARARVALAADVLDRGRPPLPA
jgi:potassium/hydrogen antiporter